LQLFFLLIIVSSLVIAFCGFSLFIVQCYVFFSPIPFLFFFLFFFLRPSSFVFSLSQLFKLLRFLLVFCAQSLSRLGSSISLTHTPLRMIGQRTEVIFLTRKIKVEVLNFFPYHRLSFFHFLLFSYFSSFLLPSSIFIRFSFPFL
jgi:hypothetical protein